MADTTIQELMTNLSAAFIPQRAGNLSAVVQVTLTGDESSEWAVTIQDGKCTVAPGPALKPQLTLSADSQVYKDIAFGRLDGMSAFMQGKIRMTGDIGLAMKFNSLFKTGG